MRAAVAVGLAAVGGAVAAIAAFRSPRTRFVGEVVFDVPVLGDALAAVNEGVSMVTRAVLDGPDAIAPWGQASRRDPYGHMLYRDPADLEPTFRRVLEQRVILPMRALGHDPVMHEGYRTDDRAAALNANVPDRTTANVSMHQMRPTLAADIYPRRKGAAPMASAFTRDLRRLAVAAGLVVLYRDGRDWDGPHVQAIPVAMQSRVRALRANPAAVATLVQRHLADTVPDLVGLA